jgi:UDP-N-acetyl-alpha-D-muramoyl-L-alanyl-L-glutamate epimerase
MTARYQQFIFEDYNFNTNTHVLELHYSFDGALSFTETFHFDFDFTDYQPEVLDRACQTLFFLAGVSYYKAYLAPEIVIKKGEMDGPISEFYAKTYQRGLGEFFYVNHLDPHMPMAFPTTSEKPIATTPAGQGEGLLIGLGGGKDSLVSVEMLRARTPNAATWSVNHRPQLTPLVERIGLPHYWVERELDQSLLEHNANGIALNGHIPISAILAAAGVVVAVLSGRRDVVVSNEQSANVPTLYSDGVAINHQYSKSQEFEQDFQALLEHTLGSGVRYYSFLRPLSELYIAELFNMIAFNHYRDVFSSCNRAFVHTSDHMFWDGSCSKCAFFFLAMTPFASRETLEALFSGKNLLLTPELQPTYDQLLGIAGERPLDCVGAIEESRAAMRMTQKQYSELRSTYVFDLPTDYDYRALNSHHMPAEIFAFLKEGLTQSGVQHE